MIVRHTVAVLRAQIYTGSIGPLLIRVGAARHLSPVLSREASIHEKTEGQVIDIHDKRRKKKDRAKMMEGANEGPHFTQTAAFGPERVAKSSRLSDGRKDSGAILVMNLNKETSAAGVDRKAPV